jgi:hypothetical protein
MQPEGIARRFRKSRILSIPEGFETEMGVNVPSVKMMPKNSASAGKSASDALVSGPRAVIMVLPLKVVITISQLLTATEVKVPARSL